jgi:hypothetical protein
MATRVRQRQCLVLVVRDVDEGAADAAVQRLQLLLQSARSFLSSARGVRRAAAAPGRNTSARASAPRCCCPAESWAGPPVGEAPDCTRSSAGAHLRLPLRRAELPHAQREGDVLRDGHVREQRIALEDHAKLAAFRRQGGDVAPVEQHGAGAGRDEARDAHQDRRLAAAGGTEQRQELAAPDLERDILHRREGAVALG